MKIICLIDSLISGGAQRQIVGLNRQLAEYNIDQKLIFYHVHNFFEEELNANSLNYAYIENKNIFHRIRSIAKSIKHEKPDLVISYLDTPNIIACIVKIIYPEIRLMVSERNTNINKITLKQRVKFFLYRWADSIIPNSYSQTEFICSNFPNLKHKTTTIVNFVDTEHFIPRMSKPKNNPIKILSVGRINPQKNLINYINAVKIAIDKGTQIEIDWYGRYESAEYYNACCNLLTKYNLKTIFRFHTPTNNIVEKYLESDVFCLPSTHEGTPNVICEAMACGLPILCSDVCDNSKIISDCENGYLFNPIIPKDIANAIIKITQISPEAKQKMGTNSRQLALEKFSKAKFIDSYRKAILKLEQND